MKEGERIRLEEQFHEEVLRAWREASELGYHANRLLERVHEHGALLTAHELLASPLEHEGLNRLWELERLDLSIEALVLEPRFAPLFSDEERRHASTVLKRYGYEPRG
jgi:hypothetical protein